MEEPLSAAAKVFATPELFEHILLYLAHDAITNKPQSFCLEPLQTLSRINRIDRTSKNIVLGSPKLQALLPTTIAHPLPNLSAARWLLFHHLGLEVWSHGVTRRTLSITVGEANFIPGPKPGKHLLLLLDFYSSSKGHADASWRRVPFYSGSDEIEHIKIWATVRFRERKSKGTKAAYEEEGLFLGDVTLGEVADQLCWVSWRSHQEHVESSKRAKARRQEWKEKGLGPWGDPWEI